MPIHYLRCDKCQTILGRPILNAPELLSCPSCRSPLLARVFPAFFRLELSGQRAEAIASDEDASCFFHARKKAVASCAECGRFVCALCDLELGGRHLCPSCVQDGQQAKRSGVGELENQRIMYDRIALLLGAWPLIPPIFPFLWGLLYIGLWMALLITGPTALYMVVRYWREPARGLVPHSQGRMIFAASLGLLQIAVGSVAIYFSYFA